MFLFYYIWPHENSGLFHVTAVSHIITVVDTSRHLTSTSLTFVSKLA